MTHVLVPNQSVPGAFSDLQITVFTFKPNGTAAPNVSFDWRCRLLQFQTILLSPNRREKFVRTVQRFKTAEGSFAA